MSNWTHPISIQSILPSISYSITREIAILSPKDICDMGFSSNAYDMQYCMRDFFEYWGTCILLKFCYNLFMPFLVIFRYWLVFKKCDCKHRVYFFTNLHFRPDSSYASIISYLEIIIMFGFVIPVLIPLCALVFLVNFFMYKKMVQFGRLMPDKKSYFPLWFLLFPILLSQIEITLFFYSMDDNHYGYTNFIVMLLVSAMIDLIAFLKWYWKRNDPAFFISTSKHCNCKFYDKTINFLYAQTLIKKDVVHDKMHIPSIPAAANDLFGIENSPSVHDDDNDEKYPDDKSRINHDYGDSDDTRSRSDEDGKKDE